MVDTIVVGAKDTFGIEYMPQLNLKTRYLHVRLWLDGFSLGTFEEETYLPIFESGLSKLLTCTAGTDLQSSSDIELKIQFKNGDIDGKYLISLGETFDDFCIARTCLNNRIVIIWDVIPSPFFSYPALPTGPFETEISFSEAQSTISKFLSNFSV